MPTPLLLIDEVSTYLRMEPPEVRELIRRGELPAIFIDEHTIRVAARHVERFLRYRTRPKIAGQAVARRTLRPPAPESEPPVNAEPSREP